MATLIYPHKDNSTERNALRSQPAHVRHELARGVPALQVGIIIFVEKSSPKYVEEPEPIV